MDGNMRGGRGGTMRGRGRGRGGLARQNDARYNSGGTMSDYVNNVDAKHKGLRERGGPTTNGRATRGDRSARPSRGRLEGAGGPDRK